MGQTVTFLNLDGARVVSKKISVSAPSARTHCCIVVDPLNFSALKASFEN